MRVIQVALDVPLPRFFDYLARDVRDDDIGRRVVVPFGRKNVVGLIVAIVDESTLDPLRLREAVTIRRDVPALPADWLALVRFCSTYYQRAVGEVAMNALPPRLRKTQALPPERQHIAITPLGNTALYALPDRQKVRRALLTRLRDGPAAPEELAGISPSAARHVADMQREGLVDTVAPNPSAPGAMESPGSHTPNAEQARAINSIGESSDAFGVFLLHGVTGSGKTEVYMQLIARTLARGKQALVLVPEINLTPQLEETFRARFPGAALLTLHSGLADAQRARQWVAAQAAGACIVLGTRLAVFTPLANPGLIVVDEEQDASFKQQDGVRYSARDLAIFRARQSGIPVVLGSATPSLESYSRALSGRYKLIELRQRAHGMARLPEVGLIDLREHPDTDGLAAPLADAIASRLERGEQSLIFLNRRGYAPVLACGACGWVSGCRRCAARLVVHLADRVLRCHHCGDTTPIPRACPDCGNTDIHPFGRGTQRLESALAARFPDARVLRVDRDSTRAKGSWSTMRDAIRDGHADILVGTQILAKGHDFPNVTLVGVINADAALHAADYRAGERLFAQIEQVAGRAGRADKPGQVLIQTRYARHPLYEALCRHDFQGFAKAVLAEREQAGFPPFVFEAVLRAEADSAEPVLSFLLKAREMAPESGEQVILFDPVPMSLSRLAGRERAQLLVQSYSRSALQSFLAGWNTALQEWRSAGVRWHVDVDPIEF